MKVKIKFKQTEIGDNLATFTTGISEGWRFFELKKLGTILTGKGIKRLDIGTYPLFGANGPLGYAEEYLEDEDLIYTGRVGTVGKINFLRKQKIWLSDNVLYFKTDDPILLKWVYYFLSQIDFSFLNVGSTQPLIKQSDFSRLMVPLPDSSVERGAITKILFDLDEKIELNYQMNKTLESIAQAIFKWWFVDFKFPGYERTKFTNGLPDGWEDRYLGDILEISIGGDWGNDSEVDGTVQAISLRGTDLEELKSSGYATDAPVRWIRKDKLEKRIVSDRDILIGGSGLGPIGKTIYCSQHLSSLYSLPVTYSNFCKRLTAKTPAFAAFAEILLEKMYLTGEMNQFYTGTSIPNLDVNSLMKYPIVIPPECLVREFYDMVKYRFAKLFNRENVVLSLIRDSLLPRLMSGKIRVGIS